MSRLKLEAYLPEQPTPQGESLRDLLRELEQEFAEKVEIAIHSGSEMPGPGVLPALFVGDFIRFIGVCPDRESLISALQASGLDAG